MDCVHPPGAVAAVHGLTDRVRVEPGVGQQPSMTSRVAEVEVVDPLGVVQGGVDGGERLGVLGRTTSPVSSARRVLAMRLGGRNGSPTAAHSAAMCSSTAANRPSGRTATPVERDLGVELVGQRRHRDAELAQQGGAVPAEVAPRAEVVAPQDGPASAADGTVGR